MTDEGKYVLHTWTRQADWRGPTVVGGQGAWFWDEDGRRYLDLSSQAECCNLGHQHPAVVRAIREQAASLCYVSNSWGASSRRDLARKIVTLANGADADGGIRAQEDKSGAADQGHPSEVRQTGFGKVFFTCDGGIRAQEDKSGAADQGHPSETRQTGFGKVFFTCDGAEATENAIKMARWFTGRHKILSRYRSYHGATHAAMKAGGDARGWNTADGLTGVVHLLPPYCFRCPFGLRYPSCDIRCAAHVEDVILFEGPHTVAAIIAEPAAGTNGIIPPVEYWPRLREICDRHGILLIGDEVMSGFGRCGEWFAWQRLGAAPDMFTMAKGLTGAHVPLGAVCVSSRVAEYFDDHLLETGLTYSGHPLACAAGVAAIRAYEDGRLIKRAQEVGSWMFGRLHELRARHGIIADVRGLGLFAVLEMDDSGGKSPKPPFPGPLPWLKALARTALERGVSVAVRGNLLILCPPLVIDQTDLESGLSVIESLL